MTDPGKTGAPDRHVWDDYNHRQEFEHALIDRKTTWLLATQAILVAGYGVTFDSSNAAQGVDGFRDVVAWLGISVAGHCACRSLLHRRVEMAGMARIRTLLRRARYAGIAVRR